MDQQIWKAGEKFTAQGIRFLPAINDALAATAVLGTQRVEADAERTCDGLFALWCGKGPGVDQLLKFGLYGWTLSRYSGTWVGFCAPSEVVKSGATVDLFGRSAERQLERSLIPLYIARVDSPLPRLDRNNLSLATRIALLTLQIWGFGHVKRATLARAREAGLWHRLDPVTWPRPAGVPQAGQIRGVAVTAERV